MTRFRLLDWIAGQTIFEIAGLSITEATSLAASAPVCRWAMAPDKTISVWVQASDTESVEALVGRYGEPDLIGAYQPERTFTAEAIRSVWERLK
jgi:hypothetical protein